MALKVKLNRTITMKECPWLDRDFAVGEELFTYTGATYGCISPSGTALSLDGETPFFEIPVDAIF